MAPICMRGFIRGSPRPMHIQHLSSHALRELREEIGDKPVLDAIILSLERWEEGDQRRRTASTRKH